MFEMWFVSQFQFSTNWHILWNMKRRKDWSYSYSCPIACSITHPSINYSVFYFLCWPVFLGRIISNWHGSVTYFRGKHHQESIIFFFWQYWEDKYLFEREKEILHNVVMNGVLTIPHNQTASNQDYAQCVTELPLMNCLT